jgi:hypothetical protein
MRKRDSLESALLLQIEALEARLSALSVEIAALHLRREAARLASDGPRQDRFSEEMRAAEAQLSSVQQELLLAEKRYHALDLAFVS